MTISYSNTRKLMREIQKKAKALQNDTTSINVLLALLNTVQFSQVEVFPSKRLLQADYRVQC